jgi:Domain of unknown function (DUF4382)
MNRFFPLHRIATRAALFIAGLLAITSCGGTTGVSSGATPPVSSGATAPLSVLITDSPSDDWQQVSVQLESVSLRNRTDHSVVQVWAAPTSGAPPTVNLVDLNGVAQFLNQATIPVGTYDRAQIVINTDPTTMTLVDDSGNIISPANIAIVDPSGKGEIDVDLSPALAVAASQSSVLQVDFDLAHPLSIVVESGKVILDLQLRHKTVPRNLQDIQFARSIGKVKATSVTSLTITTDQGTDVLFGIDGSTIFVNVDNPGATPGIADITTADFALVASNMNADGTLYARRVWFSADETKLPRFSPDGIVRRVGPNWIRVLRKNAGTQAGTVRGWLWNTDLVYVDANTTWTFKTSVPMGTGMGVLQYIRRGFRVSVEYVDPTAAIKVAKSINVQSAHDEGAVKAVTTTGIRFGGFGYCQGWTFGIAPAMTASTACARQLPYSTVAGHVFSWWFYGLPSGSSTSVQDFADTVNQADSANLRVFATAELYWDATSGAWAVEDLVLAPERVPDPARVTTAYTATGGTMGVSTFDWDTDTVPTELTVALDATGDLQTVVGSVRWNSTTRILTVTVPVLPAQWESLLTPSLQAVRVFVRPVKTTSGATTTWTWHAYTVIAYQVVG